MTDEEIEIERATRFVIDNPRAREFVWWVLEQCSLYSAHPVVNGETGIREGRRLIGTTIINRLSQVDPTAYPKMMLQALERAEIRKKRENDDPAE